MDFLKTKKAELKILMDFVYKNSIKCVKPCNTVSYEVSLQKLNKNALLVGGNGKTQVVTKCFESLSYGFKMALPKKFCYWMDSKHHSFLICTFWLIINQIHSIINHNFEILQ